MAYVYRHIRLDTNQVFYVGISKNDSPTFKRAFNKYKYHRNIHWQHVIAKTDYEVEIMFQDVSYEEAKKKEMEFISIYKRIVDGGTLVNLTLGGDGVTGFKNPKLAERNKTGIWKGRKHTEEHKKMMREKMTGRFMSDDHRRRISETRINSGVCAGSKNPKYAGVIEAYHNGIKVGSFEGSTECGKAIGIVPQRILHYLNRKNPGPIKGVFSFKRIRA